MENQTRDPEQWDLVEETETLSVLHHLQPQVALLYQCDSEEVDAVDIIQSLKPVKYFHAACFSSVSIQQSQ